MSDTESINTFNSWASNVTTCEPLEKALSTFNGNTKFQRKVLEIVTSMKNSIVKNGGAETSTEFYASMVVSINLSVNFSFLNSVYVRSLFSKKPKSISAIWKLVFTF